MKQYCDQEYCVEIHMRLLEAEHNGMILKKYPIWVWMLLWDKEYVRRAVKINRGIDYAHDMISLIHCVNHKNLFRKRLAALNFCRENENVWDWIYKTLFFSVLFSIPIVPLAIWAK